MNSAICYDVKVCSVYQGFDPQVLIDPVYASRMKLKLPHISQEPVQLITKHDTLSLQKENLFVAPNSAVKHIIKPKFKCLNPGVMLADISDTSHLNKNCCLKSARLTSPVCKL